MIKKVSPSLMLSQLEEKLNIHLDHIIRERDGYLASGGHYYVEQYITQELGKYGTVEIHEFLVKSKIYRNLILNLNADRNRERGLLLIGAHYDAFPSSPGADDNATGVAALLELARILSHANQAKYQIQLVAFDMEEYGLSGSTAYVRDLKLDNVPIRLMISLEMLGYRSLEENSQNYPAKFLELFYPSRGDFIALIGNLKTLPDLIRISRSMSKEGVRSRYLPIPGKGFPIPDIRRSDHAPFWDQNYPALMITDTAYLRNPNYHKPSDTLDTLDLNFLLNILKGLTRSINSL